MVRSMGKASKWSWVGNNEFEITRCIAVAGIFSNRDAAFRAVRDLKASGFSDNQIGLAMDDAAGEWADTLEHKAVPVRTTTMSANTTLKAGGTLASAFSLAPSHNSTVAQVLISLGIEPEDAGYFEKVLGTGCILVTVQSENNVLEAMKILEKHGALSRLEDCR